MRTTAGPLPIYCRIILALMIPLALVMLVGLGLAAAASYRLVRWQPATATLNGSTPGTIYQGDRWVGNTEERHYSFKKKEGSVGVFSFYTQHPREQELAILYSPSGGMQIKDVFRDDEWTRRSTVRWWLYGGLGLLLAGLVPCLIGGGVILATLASSRRSSSRSTRARR